MKRIIKTQCLRCRKETRHLVQDASAGTSWLCLDCDLGTFRRGSVESFLKIVSRETIRRSGHR